MDRRIKQHIRGESIYTKKFSDIKLVYTEQLPNHITATRREKQIKKWSAAKKIALIKGNIKELKRLSQTKSLTNNKGLS